MAQLSPVGSRTATPVLTSSGFLPPPAPSSDIARSPDTQAQTQASTQAQAHLPAPQSFDILPPLHALLARLEPGLENYTASPSAPLVTGVDPGHSNLPGSGTDGTGQPPLAYKDAPVAAGFLKARIRKTLAELKGLGDMDRSVDEQEIEIKALERRIALQRQVLVGLGREATDLIEQTTDKVAG
ncbi:hypothetical protein K461DRAFT_290005 [Myriangium duriaei CBS 260.36]|uniref:Mediator of RNA polymerase II transcription subunit 9 n=1 Tax=Myriangium duriaei CBS 260.36 TaxID=1168546 RepID=A0A9P4JBR9_9PEZI|nr:hypothetical protein K461DRAFT_290005 [Myriangium duriaei CBS 260.36]